jgi:inner membrane protein
MPTIFSHAIFASAVGSTIPSDELGRRFWILTALCAILPDFDVVSFYFGINYANVLGHRGITHSILFAIVVGLAVSRLFFASVNVAWWKLALYFAGVTLSHTLLDMLTNGGLGVALLAPFSNERFFFPWRPIEVSPIGAGFLSERGVSVILSEVVWLWLPSLLIVLLSWLARRKSR